MLSPSVLRHLRTPLDIPVNYLSVAVEGNSKCVEGILQNSDCLPRVRRVGPKGKKDQTVVANQQTRFQANLSEALNWQEGWSIALQNGVYRFFGNFQ